MSPFGLAPRLFVVAMVTLVPTVILLLSNIYLDRERAEQALHLEARNTAHLARLEVSRIIGGVESTLLTVAASLDMRMTGDANCQDFLVGVTRQLPQLAAVAIFDENDEAICETSPTTMDSETLMTVRTSAQVQTGLFTRLAGLEVLPVAIPAIYDGRPLIFVGFLDLDWLGSRIAERGFDQGNALTITDRKGIIVARQPYSERFVGVPIVPERIHLVFAAEPGSTPIQSVDGTHRILGFFPASSTGTNGLFIAAGITVEPVNELLNRTTLLSLLAVVISILVALIAAQIANHVFIQRPFRKLISTVAAWQDGATDVRTGLQDHAAEFGKVGRALDGFMDQLLLSRAQRKMADEQRLLVLGELDHRMKNLIATVQAVARQTFRGKGQDEAVRSFNSRLSAMANAHQLLLADTWQAASISALVKTAISAFESPEEERFHLEGTDFVLPSRAVMTLAMALHELCTNAAKYGALSVLGGQVRIAWNIDPDGTHFTLDWRESGGPPVSDPEKTGFGSTMIKNVLAQQLNGDVEIDYAPDGLHCIIHGTLG